MSVPWPADRYDRGALPERILQFGTGMLLRAISAATVDAANRTGAYNGRIVVVQSTSDGVADAINQQDGLFTLVEQGIERGESVERTQAIGAISRALVADTEWDAVRAVVVRPELRIIISNVTEAGFRNDDSEPSLDASSAAAPHSFPAKLADLLLTRFRHLPDGPSLFVIPTELVTENGPILAAMVDRLVAAMPDPDPFRAWIARAVTFCSSLVDRITVAPSPEVCARFAARLGYQDALLTVTEPHALWAIEGDAVALHDAFPVDNAARGVIFAADIASFRDRKLRMLNGAHTALAPLALMAGVRTVREAVAHRYLGRLLRQLLFDEIIPTVAIPSDDAVAYANSVLDRFRNPWLDHEWRVIATNQTAKLRARVVPSILGYYQQRNAPPPGLALAFAASLRLARAGGQGWWSGETGPIVDVDRDLIDQHWRHVDPEVRSGRIPAPTLARFAEEALGDATIWGEDLRTLPGLSQAVTHALSTIQP